MSAIENASSIQRELRLLFHGGRADLTSFDPERLFSHLDYEGVSLLALEAIEGTGTSCAEDVLRALRNLRLQTIALEALRLAEIRRVADTFRQRSIPILLLKGTPLAYSIYRAAELRPRADTDLLVDEEQLHETRALFEELGYATGPGAELAHVSTQLSVSREDRQVTHTFDVHWKLSNAPAFADRFDWSELSSRAHSVDAISPFAMTLATADALIYACMHRVAHHHASRRLIWLYDVMLLCDSLTADEVAVMHERARSKGLTAICRDTIEQAAHWFAPDPETFIERYAPAVTAGEESARFLVPASTRGEQLRRDLRAIGTWRRRARYLLEMAFPPPRFMKRRYGVESNLLLPLLYFRRAIGGFASLLRKAAG